MKKIFVDLLSKLLNLLSSRA